MSDFRPYFMRFFSSLLAGIIISTLFLACYLSIMAQYGTEYKVAINNILTFEISSSSSSALFGNFLFIIYFALFIFIGDLFCSTTEFLITIKFFRNNNDKEYFENVFRLSPFEKCNNCIKIFLSITTLPLLPFVSYHLFSGHDVRYIHIYVICLSIVYVAYNLIFKCNSYYEDDKYKIIYDRDFANCIRNYNEKHFLQSEVFFNFHRFWGGITLALLIASCIIAYHKIVETCTIFLLLFCFSFYLTIKYRECGNEHLQYSKLSIQEEICLSIKIEKS